MRHLPFFVLCTALVAALAACGGPSSPPPPPEPDAVSVTPMVAARGDTIVVTGSGFGATPGTVTVSDAQATVTQWTDVSITATLADGTPNAWSDVTVTTDGGSDTVTGLFVGAEFSGTAAELPEFLDESPIHSAVLLQAAAYDLSALARPLVFDNVDLYGRGADLTSIAQPTAELTVALADNASTTTIADMTLEGDRFTLARGSFRDTIAPFAVVSGARHVPTDPAEVEAVFREAAQRAVEAADAAVSPAAVTPATIVFDGVTYQETGGGVWGFSFGLGAIPQVDLVFRDSTFNLPTTLVFAAAVGDVSFESTKLTASMLVAASLLGDLTVVDSDLTGESSSLVAGQTSLSVTDSTVRVKNGDLEFSGISATTLGSGFAAGGPVAISGSTIEVLDATPLDATAAGGLYIETAFAPIALTDNQLIRSHYHTIITTLASDAGEGDIELSGNRDVRVGIFAADFVGSVREATLAIAPVSSTYATRVTLDGNTIATTGDINAHDTSAAVNVHASNNTITAGDGVNPGWVRFGSSGGGAGTVEVTGNVISTQTGVTVQGSDPGADVTTVVSGNTVTSVSAAAGGLVVQAANSCVVTDNVVNAVDETETVMKNLMVSCAGTEPTHDAVVTGNEVTTAGSSGSGPMLMLFSPGSATVELNEFEGPAVGAYAASESLTFASNTMVTHGGGLAFMSSSPDTTIADNTLTHHDPAAPGLHLAGFPGSVTVTGNTFTGVGSPTADATAFDVLVGGPEPMTLIATGNTFTNYSTALHVMDSSPIATGIDATITENVFDFTIDTVGDVATLTNVKDVIDATNNQWGGNTDLATVEGLVVLDGDTTTQGGGIDLDPITQP